MSKPPKIGHLIDRPNLRIKHASESKTYHHARVKNNVGCFIDYLMTDSELARCHGRGLKNPEDAKRVKKLGHSLPMVNTKIKHARESSLYIGVKVLGNGMSHCFNKAVLLMTEHEEDRFVTRAEGNVEDLVY